MNDGTSAMTTCPYCGGGKGNWVRGGSGNYSDEIIYDDEATWYPCSSCKETGRVPRKVSIEYILTIILFQVLQVCTLLCIAGGFIGLYALGFGFYWVTAICVIAPILVGSGYSFLYSRNQHLYYLVKKMYGL